jgi:putative beta-lysine N-acetyltransferase
MVQHGSKNDRVYLMKLVPEDMPELIEHIDNLVAEHGYSKAFIKIPHSMKVSFSAAGYQTEAVVPDLFGGSEEGVFMARYFDKERQHDERSDLIKKVLETAHTRSEQQHKSFLPEGCHCRLLNPSHCQQMAKLYRQTFASYPFPISDPKYIANTMAEDVLYTGIWKDGDLLALASAEIDREKSNAELTDFATTPDWRGHGLANLLLQTLEQELQLLGIKTGYTIARATSYAMNICFAQNGYKYSGTLKKNTQIAGDLESMNVWNKCLERKPAEQMTNHQYSSQEPQTARHTPY